MFYHLGALVSRRPYWVLGFWSLALLVCLPFGLRVGEVLTPDPDPAPNSVAREVQHLLAQEFKEQGHFQVLLIAQPALPGLGNTDAAFTAAFDDVVGRIRMLPETLEVIDYRNAPHLPLRAADGRSSVALIRLNTSGATAEREALVRIEALLKEEPLLAFFISGNAVVKQALHKASQRDARRAELFGLPLSLLILVFAFGTLVAAGLPLLVAVLSITVSLALLFALGQIFVMASFVQTLVSMLGLSTGINYALVMVHRFREELANGLSPRAAATVTTASAGKAVGLSGLTVVIALAALLVPPLPFVRSIGLGGMVVMLVSVTAAVTALPASLTLLGRRVNALAMTRRSLGERNRTFWRGHATRVLKRPAFFITLGLTGLLFLTLPASEMQVAFSRSKGLIGDPGIVRAQELLEQAGFSEPLRSFDVLIDFDEQGFYNPSSVRQLSQFTRQSGSLHGVSQVVSATSTPLPALLLAQYYASPEVARASPLSALVETTVSRDGHYALVSVFPDSTLGPRATSVLAAELERLAAGLNLNVSIGGQMVADAEWARALYSSLPLSVLLVVLSTFLVLGLTFRSVLIPLKAVLLNAFTIGAACGVVVLVFQEGWLAPFFGLPGGLGFVETVVPLFLFTLVFGLSMDYEVFVLSRLQEAHGQGASTREAVLHAVASTGGIITSAALIMFTVFLMFTFSSVVLIKALSVGLVVAVLLDATLVRLTLVPAILFLSGRWNWWRPF